MTSYDDASPEVRAAVESIQRDIRAAVDMMAETYALIDGEEIAWPKGSVAAIAFEAGVEAGSAAAMSVFHQRGWLTFPTPGEATPAGGDRS